MSENALTQVDTETTVTRREYAKLQIGMVIMTLLLVAAWFITGYFPDHVPFGGLTTIGGLHDFLIPVFAVAIGGPTVLILIFRIIMSFADDLRS